MSVSFYLLSLLRSICIFACSFFWKHITGHLKHYWCMSFLNVFALHHLEKFRMTKWYIWRIIFIKVGAIILKGITLKIPYFVFKSLRFHHFIHFCLKNFDSYVFEFIIQSFKGLFNVRKRMITYLFTLAVRRLYTFHRFYLINSSFSSTTL